MTDAPDDAGRGRLGSAGPLLRARLARHEAALWWLHSAYVLALGAGIMWLGARNYAWLRYSGFYLAAIWVLSLFLTNVVHRHEGVWWGRARFLVNYVNKNLYQQLLFFVLPIYAGSTTWSSRNVVFLAVLAASAVLSTLDLVYDRVLSARRVLAAWFFAFNAFAVVTVALPVTFGVALQPSARAGAVAGAAGFVTLAWRLWRLGRPTAWAGVAAGAVVVFLAAESARPLVPPAPLHLTSVEFGSGLDRGRMQITGRLAICRPAAPGACTPWPRCARPWDCGTASSCAGTATPHSRGSPRSIPSPAGGGRGSGCGVPSTSRVHAAPEPCASTWSPREASSWAGPSSRRPADGPAGGRVRFCDTSRVPKCP